MTTESTPESPSVPKKNILAIVEEGVLASGIMIIAIVTVANVFSRTFLGFSLAFAEELAQFLIVLVTFVGLSYGAGVGRHIRMTALYDELPHRPRRGMRIFICLFTSGLLAYLAWAAISYAMTVYTLGTVSAVLQVPLGLVYLSAPFGLALASLQYLLAAWRNLRSDHQIYLAYNVPEVYDAPPMDGI